MITTCQHLNIEVVNQKTPSRKVFRSRRSKFSPSTGAATMSSFVAFLSGADQYGRWVPEQEITASAYLGGSTVDFSQALFKYPVPWSEVGGA